MDRRNTDDRKARRPAASPGKSRAGPSRLGLQSAAAFFAKILYDACAASPAGYWTRPGITAPENVAAPGETSEQLS
jgi:hypothetical protein